MKHSVTVNVAMPVFVAGIQLIFAALLFAATSIVLHWPANLLPGLYLMTSTICYALVMWAAREGRPHE